MLRLNGQCEGCRKFAIRFEATPRILATADVCRHGGGATGPRRYSRIRPGWQIQAVKVMA
jgi:hypothetical protein